MHNDDVARLFSEYADLLEIRGANAFRIRAYRNAARTIKHLGDDVATIATRGKQALQEYAGIGPDLADRILEIVQTSRMAQLEELRGEVPPGVRDMLRIPGIGPKKVATLFAELGVETLEDLKQAVEEGRVASLKGFGKKTAQTILEGLTRLQESGKRYHISHARAAAETLANDLLEIDEVSRVEVAGSCRRRQETCGDLDLLAVSSHPAAAMDRLASHTLVEKELSRGDTKQRVRLHLGIELDLRVVPEESYGAALQYFTGSKEHNVALRRRVQQQGLKLNEYGIYRDDEFVAGAAEEDVYAAVGLPWIPPELREGRGEIEAAEQHRLPQLITLDDIRGDLHMHTTATDGTASIEEMATEARSRGLEYIAITDHSKRVAMANGLDADRLRAHWKEIEKVQEQFDDLRILRGIECDILEDATLDLPDDVLAEADWVIAVIHYGLGQPREQIMKRLLTAVRNPFVSIIGHPSGRMIGKRPGADIDYPTLFKAAADHGVMMEINANPARLDLADIPAAMAAREYNIPIVISTDAHAPRQLDLMEYGVDQGRRAWLEKQHVANTLPWDEFRRLLRRPQ